MNNLIKKIETICFRLSQIYNLETIKNEDYPVIKFLDKEISGENLSYIEIGSGLGRFVDVVSSLNKFNISCLEINADLAKKTNDRGFKTLNANLIDNNLPSNEFDIVHCSHVIEHISYPHILKALDELIRITKVGGYIIIRSPLMSPAFFTCIDHIRPYPPKSIIDFYSNPQQQVTGHASIQVIKEKLRKEALIFFPYSSNRISLAINLVMKILWTYFKCPHSKPNGYTLILQKK